MTIRRSDCLSRTPEVDRSRLAFFMPTTDCNNTNPNPRCTHPHISKIRLSVLIMQITRICCSLGSSPTLSFYETCLEGHSHLWGKGVVVHLTMATFYVRVNSLCLPNTTKFTND